MRTGALAAGLLALAACGGDAADAPRDGTSLVAAGDISGCFWRGDEATARLLDGIGGIVAPLGDAVYQRGTDEEFRRCYHPTWGRYRERTRPTPGNHEYKTRDAAGYFRYFGDRAGEAGKGWYSYDHDGWHVIVLNSQRREQLEPGSEQMRWLRRDLARSDARCTLAYFHHPRFSSEGRGNERMRQAFRMMYDAGVDVVLSGHEHHYERFAPLDAEGRPDPRRGIRQFVVGTGGAPSYRLPEDAPPHSEVRAGDVRGVLRLVFHPGAYEWEFVPIPGRRFTDAGRGTCH